jgi:hypothetical protein
MLVYVESNFVLELAYLQEDHGPCESLLLLAEQQAIGLSIPSFCLCEPYEAWGRRAKSRTALHSELRRQIRELSRSLPYGDLQARTRELEHTLIQSNDDEQHRLDSTIARIVNVATIIPVDRSVIHATIQLRGGRGLSPQDAIVYASVLSHMTAVAAERKCFVTRNTKDFSGPAIESDLQAVNCKLLFRFDDAFGYVRSHLDLARSTDNQ